MTKVDAFMPLWIGEYLADTLTFTTQQHGAYLLLLMAYWRERAALPDDDEALRSIAKVECSEWKKLRPVLARKFRVEGGVWWHKRVEQELASAMQRKEKASSKAQAAAEARWKQSSDDAPSIAPSIAPSTPQALHEDCPSSSPKEEIPNTPPHPPGGVSFGEFWDQWPRHPRKVARLQCAKKWASFGLDAIADEVLASLKAHKSSKAWAKDAGDFIPAPLVWLNQRRWEAPTEAEAANEAAEANWRESRSGIESKGSELGLGPWDQRAFELGDGEPFSAYTARVMKAAGEAPRKVAA